VPPRHANRRAYIAWLAVCVLWGTTYLGIRIALETIPPALVGGLRFTAAGIFLVAMLAAGGQTPIRPHQWGGLALTGVLTICVGNGGVIWAEQWVPSGVAAVTVATIPFWMIAIEMFTRDGDPLSGRLVLGLLVGFGGILLLVWPDIASGGVAGHRFLAGIVALQVACVGWALGSSVSRRHARQENVLSAAAMQMLFGGLVMLVAATMRGEWTQLAFTPRTLLAELYLTLAGSIVGYSAYTYALRHLPTATVSLYAYANPVIAIVLGGVVAGEPFGPRVIVASMMVLIGSALVRWKDERGVTDRSFRATAQSRRRLPDWVQAMASSDDAAAADQTDQEQHDRDHQQNPDKVTQRVATDHSQQPENDQNNRNGLEHV
jgi:drug/metabolite transporter (DMT)-like permease